MGALRILIVDDVPTQRFMSRRFFQRSDLGAEVVEADSGEAAIALLEEQDFDCVLCDQRMGAASGVDVLAFARERRPHAVRCLLTGFADPDLAQQAWTRAKVHALIEKPMEVHQLWETLEAELVTPFLRPRLAPASG